MATHVQDPSKNYETPILGFSSRRQNGIHFVGLLFPAGGRL